MYVSRASGRWARQCGERWRAGRLGSQRRCCARTTGHAPCPAPPSPPPLPAPPRHSLDSHSGVSLLLFVNLELGALLNGGRREGVLATQAAFNLK
eukprot:1742349-Rhodomonas_salina.2